MRPWGVNPPQHTWLGRVECEERFGSGCNAVSAIRSGVSGELQMSSEGGPRSVLLCPSPCPVSQLRA